MILLSKAHDAAIRRHGETDFPHECCGVLLGSITAEGRMVQEVRPLGNVHEDGHERRYLVSPDEMFALMREERKTGVKILGFYHSHPDHPAEPSVYDRDWASPWYTYIIVSVMAGKAERMTAWTLVEDHTRFDVQEISIGS